MRFPKLDQIGFCAVVVILVVALISFVIYTEVYGDPIEKEAVVRYKDGRVETYRPVMNYFVKYKKTGDGYTQIRLNYSDVVIIPNDSYETIEIRSVS